MNDPACDQDMDGQDQPGHDRPLPSSLKHRRHERFLVTLSPEEIDAIKLSLRVSTLAMAASLPFGIAMAMVLTRTRFYGRMLLNALVLLPLVLPPVVTGYVLLLLFGRQGPIGRFLDEQFGIVLAFR